MRSCAINQEIGPTRLGKFKHKREITMIFLDSLHFLLINFENNKNEHECGNFGKLTFGLKSLH